MLNPHHADDESIALGLVLRRLAGSGYRFITPTPLTHSRVLGHRGKQTAADLRDVFGWNLPFKIATCDGMTRELLAAMRGAGVLQTNGDLLQSRVRVASIDDDLYVHSSYPATHNGAVFFGPDSYRFSRFVQQVIATSYSPGNTPIRILDVGCGSGAGGIVAARALAQVKQVGPLEVNMNDINPLALQYTAVNAAHANLAGVAIKPTMGNALRGVAGDFDLIISNPPYLADIAQRAYRHCGERLERALGVRIGEEALARLAPGGRLLMYTGVAIVNGFNRFLADMQLVLADSQFDWSYSEIDPDVFGEELDQPAYTHVDRIAAIGLTVTRRAAH